MDSYFWVKLIHIIAAVVVTGTGAGIAFFMLMAVRSKSEEAIRVVSRHVVLADWIFTAPAVVIQLLSGIYLMNILNYSFGSLWFLTVISLFVFIGVCWIPVLFIQHKLRNISQSENFELKSSQEFNKLFKIWVVLGIPAFTAILVLFWLMVFKPLPIS